MEEVSVEDIQGMGAGQVFQLARKRQVSLTGCNDLEQWKQRLVLHHLVQKEQHFDIQREFGMRNSENLETTRQTLDELFDSVQAAMTGLDPSLERKLRADSGGSDDISSVVQQILQRRRSLRISQCSIVVAGETNAGKSTFLNLLLGVNVLPISIFSCTSAICVLRYAEDYSAEVVSHDGRVQQQDFKGVEEARDWLDNAVAEKDVEKRGQVSTGIKAIHVRLPAVILQCGVTLVDTPGIGENEAMYNCTMDYVKSNSAAAYIYVIKTDNAGGVHDDRLLEFLRAILQHTERDANAESFDPSCALFVCNRWDQVPPDQQKGVRENALSKLRDVWPGFEPQQAFFLSSINAQLHMNADSRYVTEDYKQVLKGLKDTFGQARHNAVNQHYRWLKHLLHQSTSFLQTAVHHCSHTDEELADRFRATRQKLDALQRRTTATIQQLRHKVEEEIDQLCRKMAAILQDASVKQELRDWSMQRLPATPSSYGTGEVQRWMEEVDTHIMRRIMDTVDRELQSRGDVETLKDTLRQMTQAELRLVDEEINSILSDLNDRSSLGSSVSSNSSCQSVDSDEDTHSAVEMLRIYKIGRGKTKGGEFHMAHLKSVSRVTESARGSQASARASSRSEATMASVPKLMVRRMIDKVLHPLSLIKQTRRRSLYENNPVHFMEERTDKMVRVVSETHSCLVQMAAKHYDKLNEFIRDVENSIPRFIANNKKVMEDIKTNRRSYLSRRKELVVVMERLEPVREMLRGFGSLYIRDVTADNVCFTLDETQRRQSVAVDVFERGSKTNKSVISKDSGLGDSRRNLRTSRVDGSLSRPATTGRVTRGLWSAYRWGHVTIGEQQQHVVGRSYIHTPGENSLIKEIARLRCLRSDDLAPFLGMSHMDDTAVFLFMGDITPARRYIRSAYHEPRESVPHILEGVLRGLMYLHREGLVHMDLSLDSVMVNREGQPKLCGACLPRHARFPPDVELVDAEPFMCLSPEVLRGDLYTADDDTYSFGLLVWETCLPHKPYRDQRKARLSLEEFRRSVHPSSMLGLDSDLLTQSLSPLLSEVLRGCLLPARGLRTRTEELRERVQALRSDSVVQALSAAGRRDGHRPLKRAGSDEV